ncbi:DNA repair protein RecO [Flavobacteriales bacterium]|nr:DNA repair protein RecO [Flavobacteriales bacterium]|tara:strand:- start:140 stop:847 length:708 start_codon:yes stop_codon:yes gene_type:complete
MKYKSRAITLTYIKYGESSIISKIFTEKYGLQTFIIKGARSKKAKKKLGIFQPLELVDINATLSPKKGFQYLAEITIIEAISSDKINMNKKFLAIFIAEISSKVLQENEQNSELFKFIWEIKQKLYNANTVDENFALLFMLNLSKYLGFSPSIENINAPFFNLETGEFSEKGFNLNIYLNEEKTKILKYILVGKKINIPQKLKSDLLKDIMTYFRLHHYNLSNITSHSIIESLRK